MTIFPKNHVIFMQKWIHYRLSPSLFVLPTPLNFNHFNISHGSFIYLLTTPSLSNLAIFTILTRITLHFSLPTFLFSHKQAASPTCSFFLSFPGCCLHCTSFFGPCLLRLCQASTDHHLPSFFLSSAGSWAHYNINHHLRLLSSIFFVTLTIHHP